MKQLTKEQLIASSSSWVSIALNLLPGLGIGYIYQRRWKAYWATTAVAFLWLILGALSQASTDPSDPLSLQNDSVGIWGFLAIALFTSIESVFAIRNARSRSDRENTEDI